MQCKEKKETRFINKQKKERKETMSKLNPSARVAKTRTAKEVFDSERLAGGKGMYAAKQDEFALLRRAVLANLLWEDIAYMDGMSVAEQIKQLVPLCVPQDVARLTIEARKVQKLRHTPLFLAVEMAKYPDHNALLDVVLPEIITRADMLTDFLALYWKDGKCPITNKIKKGLAKAFDNFDEYQFAKYNRDNQIKIRDVMFLTHPKAKNNEQEVLFNKIASNTLETPDTWEVALSSGADKLQTWIRLIESRKIGGLAMLRNLSNMVSAKVPENIIKKGIENISSSMLLPLDFYKAANHNEAFKKDIEKAMIKAYSHLPKLKGKTLFIIDVSGSMGSLVSGKSQATRLTAAIAMAMLASNQCEDYTLVATAGNDWKHIGAHEVIQNPSKGFDLFNQIKEVYRRLGGGGIFTRQCLDWCRERFYGVDFERIIIFSDSQDCDNVKTLPSPFGKYNYICDVSSHTKGINYKGIWTSEITGFSENFLSYIAANEGLMNLFNSSED